MASESPWATSEVESESLQFITRRPTANFMQVSLVFAIFSLQSHGWLSPFATAATVLHCLQKFKRNVSSLPASSALTQNSKSKEQSEKYFGISSQFY
jgi:hypothetical protein